MEEKISKALAKQGIKGGSFNVELIVDQDGNTTFIIRTSNGIPVRIVNDSTDVAQFFNEITNEIKASYDTKD